MKSSLLETFLVVCLVIGLLMPERSGQYAHEFVNKTLSGWNSVSPVSPTTEPR